MNDLKRRIDRLEQAERPAAQYELLWNMSRSDYRVWAGQEGNLSNYLELMSVAGLLWLEDGETIISYWIDIGDGGWLESQPPVVRRVRYTPRGGWGNRNSIKVWDYSSQAGRAGLHVSQLEPQCGDPWPRHWPFSCLPVR